MVNPFDKAFFKFFIGFVCILCFSFSILYMVGRFGNLQGTPAAAVREASMR